MADKLSRREFLVKAGIIGVTTAGLTLGGGELLGLLDDEAEAAGASTLSIAKGGTPAALTKKAIDGLGGMGRFVKRGNTVVIKPNLAWACPPEQAGNTNPEVLSTVIKLCKQAGASRVTVVDHTCDSAQMAFNINGGRKAATSAGARIIAPDNPGFYQRINIPRGKVLKSDDCVKEILNADVFINIPIAKVHGSSRITASMKNLMGVIWDRGRWHSSDLDQCIADFASAVRPDLVILDANRVLLTNGPKGPGETKNVGQVIASTDFVAIDAYAATLLGFHPNQVNHIAYAASMGLGQMDLKKVKMKKA